MDASIQAASLMNLRTFLLCGGGLLCFCGAVTVRDHDYALSADVSMHDLYSGVGRDDLVAELDAMRKQLASLKSELASA